jgi:hypothetical protein
MHHGVLCQDAYARGLLCLRMCYQPPYNNDWTAVHVDNGRTIVGQAASMHPDPQ